MTQPRLAGRHAVALGIDYGTESGRVLALDLVTGVELATAVVPYRHGVIDRALPGSQEPLPPDWALQHPQDYLDVLYEGIPQVLSRGQVDPSQVVGLGVDCTASTDMPVDAEGMPLALDRRWAHRPHAWPKLWKHHAAHGLAEQLTARARGQEFLGRYGGRISSEWYFPKLLQVFLEDRDVYDAMARFIEATDWIVWHLTGREARSACAAGYKALWAAGSGTPDAAYFRGVCPDFGDPSAKLGHVFYPPGTDAGPLAPSVAASLGLGADVRVAVGNVDAMVSAPAVGLTGPGTLVMVMGTSICHLTVSSAEVRMPGITGVVRDGVLPGWFGYEAGQAAVGDMFAWFLRTAVPRADAEAAERRGVSLYEYLEEQARGVAPGASGLLAFDWWNGNRSILGDTDLSGVLVGLTLSASSADVYRALLEGAALGTRRILDNFREHGVPIDRVTACGGLPQRSPLLMQIYADVLGLPVDVPASSEVPARGSAMFGAVAAGSRRGGFDSLAEAVDALASPLQQRFQPCPSAHAVYTDVYQVYRELYQRLGEDAAPALHRLKSVRRETLSSKVPDCGGPPRAGRESEVTR